MGIDETNDARIVDSWHKNATPWTTAVRLGEIKSRRAITDQAIVDAVLSRKPHTVLDIGCGEGWLARVLSREGCQVIGTDVVPALIEQARRAGPGDYRVTPYEDIAAGRLDVTVNVAVCNFSLVGNASVTGLFYAVQALLRQGGAFIVQTLHPLIACGDAPYQDGWRQGSWKGFNSNFSTLHRGISAPWKAD